MSTGDSSETSGRIRVPIHEFFVDFLGGLVPGVLFLLGTIIALLPALYSLQTAFQVSQPAIIQQSGVGGSIPAPDSTSNQSSVNTYNAIAPNHDRPPGILTLVAQGIERTHNTPNMIWIAVFVGWLLFSYMLGALFFRQDPKIPDQKSFKKIVYEKYGVTFSQPGLVPEEEIELQLKEDYACTTPENCQFPFPYLYEYLEARGHDHLLYLVPWNDDIKSRSKTYINLLKIRLRHHFPTKIWRIVRNEAHVRMATSTWYVAEVLQKVSKCALIIILTSLIFDYASWMLEITPSGADDLRNQGGFNVTWYYLGWVFPSLTPAVIVLLTSNFAQDRIEGFVHYQRLREVFYVLETAATAFSGENEENLGDPFEKPDNKSSNKKTPPRKQRS